MGMKKIDATDYTVGVVGAGAMGQGIAQVSAQGGMRTIILDVKPGAAEAAKASGADIRLGEMAEAIYAKLDAKGFGSMDFSGVFKDLTGELGRGAN